LNSYDVVVVGVGGIGSAAAYHLAKAGASVLGLDQYDIPNDLGSSHGITRIIRLAYYEDPSYVPLLKRSYELWHDLEFQSGKELLITTGSIDAGPVGSDLVAGSVLSCQEYNLDHEIWDSSQLHEVFPGYTLPENYQAVYQPAGGFLLPEEAIVAYSSRAMTLGAEIHGREKVVSWKNHTDQVEVITDKATYYGNKLLICSGAWTSNLLPNLSSLLMPERQVVGWFQPIEPKKYTPENFPVFNLLWKGERYYGFPVYSVPGVKIGRYHHLRQAVNPDTMDREPNQADELVLREFLNQVFPSVAGSTLSLETCIFTNTPDEHFLLDHYDGLDRIWVASGFSGHGFKFAAVIGEIMANLAGDQAPGYDISLFRAGRFAIG